MSTKTIYLIRHAQPAYPGGVKMCLGQKNDLPLSGQGFEQAAALTRFFEHIPLDAVYSSPLLRARQTAAAIAGNQRPLHILNDLIELNGGEWDGLTHDQLRERYPAHFGPNAKGGCPPGGESDESGLARMLTALSYIETRTQTCAAIVAHSGVNRLLLCHLSGLPLTQKKTMGQDLAAVSVIACTNGIWRVTHHSARPLRSPSK